MSAQSAIFNPTLTTSAASGSGFSVPRLTTTGRLAIAFGIGDSGMMVYDTTLNNLFIWTGSAWESVPASGDAGVNGAVQYNDNGVVSGATNFVYNKVNQKVGIGTITPNVELDVVGSATITGALDAARLNVTGATIPANGVYLGSANNLSFSAASTLAMTLNSTGLGIGVSPITALSFPIGTTKIVAQSAVTSHLAGNAGTMKFGITDGGGDYSGLHVVNSHNGTFSSQDLLFFTGEGGVSICTERMRITRTGNVGIGVTPSAFASGIKGLQVGSLGGSTIMGYSNACEIGSNFYFDSIGYKYGATAATSLIQFSAGEFRFKTAGSGTANNPITFTQAMTLDASGNLLVGTTASGGQAGFCVLRPLSSGVVATTAEIAHNFGALSGTTYTTFLFATGVIGSITQSGTTGVLYNVTSDYRLKESVVPLSGGLARVNALKPSVYNWKSDGSTGEGFLAHELSEVVPTAVSGEKDAVNADGSIKPQGIDMSRIVPILVAAIQELTARLQILEAR